MEYSRSVIGELDYHLSCPGSSSCRWLVRPPLGQSFRHYFLILASDFSLSLVTMVVEASARGQGKVFRRLARISSRTLSSPGVALRVLDYGSHWEVPTSNRAAFGF